LETWTLLDADGNSTGGTLVRGERIPPGTYHLVVHIWVEDDKGRLLIQKRASTVKLMPDVWAATGGSAVAGESSRDAAHRELLEELGLDVPPARLLEIGRLKRHSSFCDLWLTRCNVDVTQLSLQREEVAEARWVTWDKLMEMAGTRDFHHYGREYFQFLREGIRRIK